MHPVLIYSNAPKRGGNGCNLTATLSGLMHVCMGPPFFGTFCTNLKPSYNIKSRTPGSGCILPVDIIYLGMNPRNGQSSITTLAEDHAPCMFLNTVNKQCVRLLLEPKEQTLYAMVAPDQDAAILLSQVQLQEHFRALFPCLGQGMSHIENECITCMERFSASNPRMCLPCVNEAQNIMRHCSLCKNCMRRWITETKSKMVTICPICRTQFDAQELEIAFNEGYLDYPIDDKPVASVLRGWHASEDTNERKKKGLGDLRVVPASQEWPIPRPVPRAFPRAVEDLWTPRFFRVNTGPRMRPVVNARGDVRYIFR